MDYATLGVRRRCGPMPIYCPHLLQLRSDYDTHRPILVGKSLATSALRFVIMGSIVLHLSQFTSKLQAGTLESVSFPRQLSRPFLWPVASTLFYVFSKFSFLRSKLFPPFTARMRVRCTRTKTANRQVWSHGVLIAISAGNLVKLQLLRSSFVTVMELFSQSAAAAAAAAAAGATQWLSEHR